MLIDCDACAVRGPACRDCVVTVLLGAPSARPGRGAHTPGTGIDLDHDEQAAIAVLAGSGLVPPLRLVARPTDPDEAGMLNWDHEPGAAPRSARRRRNGASPHDHRAAG
jgi:hypothetical protein